jgi:hypothetical protein
MTILALDTNYIKLLFNGIIPLPLNTIFSIGSRNNTMDLSTLTWSTKDNIKRRQLKT